MDYTSLIIGIIALGFGLVTLVARFTGKMQSFSKLAAMKQLYGEKKGNLIHLVGYTILPLVAGAVLVAAAFMNKVE
ncbi:MAG: hypothetical protein V4615_11585 [Bacteroidota bacterium]